MMKQLSILLFTIVLTAGCQSKKMVQAEPESPIRVVHLKNMETPADSVLIYALPRNGLRFKITGEKTIRRTGPLYRFSERSIGIKDIILRNEETFKITGVELEITAEPDPAHYYSVSTTGNILPLVQLTENGCILSYNGPQPKQEISREKIQKPKAPLDTAFRFTPYLEDQVVVNSTAKMAEEAARFIYRIRDNRAALVSGELDIFPSNGEALALSLKEMDRLERDFVSLFTGKEAKEELVWYVNYIPENPVNKDLVFRFSQFRGLVDKTDLSGSPVYVSVTLKRDLPETNTGEGDVKNKGLFYRVPSVASVKLTEGNTTLLDTEAYLAQFGPALSLPSTLFNDPSVSILFYENTGAIKHILKK